MSYDNAKACAVVETTADVTQNMINVDQNSKPHAEIQPENNFNEVTSVNFKGTNVILDIKHCGQKYKKSPV